MKNCAVVTSHYSITEVG